MADDNSQDEDPYKNVKFISYVSLKNVKIILKMTIISLSRLKGVILHMNFRCCKTRYWVTKELSSFVRVSNKRLMVTYTIRGGTFYLQCHKWIFTISVV
ncbi:hypothetical protein C0J52_12110 [Blattella germanica]|nr:hypothetical protein C0J52_12110 [Blattella germanica]